MLFTELVSHRIVFYCLVGVAWTLTLVSRLFLALIPLKWAVIQSLRSVYVQRNSLLVFAAKAIQATVKDCLASFVRVSRVTPFLFA